MVIDNTDKMMAKTIANVLASFPFYGGTAPVEEEKTEDGTEEKTEEGKKADAPPIAPPAVAELVKQIDTLNTTVSDLQKKNETYETEKKTKERAGLGREEALTKDLEDRDQIIQKMDAALRNQAVINAINSFTDVQFHDPKFAMSKLSPEIFEKMQVDLENGTVTVTGVENDLRRVAKEYEWAVKKAGATETAPPVVTPPARATGGAPRGGGGDSSTATTRKAHMARYPVIAHGRRT